MVLVVAVDGDGKVKRKCDARCYNAKGSDCHCVCGGRNHGLGFEEAKAKTLAESASIVSDHASDKDYGDLEVRIKI
jgi:hypothetical protein